MSSLGSAFLASAVRTATPLALAALALIMGLYNARGEAAAVRSDDGALALEVETANIVD